MPDTSGRKLKSWLKGYAEYTAESESPEAFHLWTALSTIAGAAQRKIYIPTAYFTVHTNMYISLVSPPGIGKKTTAQKIGQNILAELPDVHFAPDATSAQSLITEMAEIPSKEHQSMTAFASELGTLFGSNPADIVEFLVNIYDGNPNYRKSTISRGKEKLERPWLNVHACTTPEWLGDNLSSVAVEGGLVARFLFIYEDERILKSPLPKGNPRLDALREDLITDLALISNLRGEFEFTPEAEAFYSQWYLDESRFPSIRDPRTAGYFDRKHIHTLKVAMAISLAEKNDLVLDINNIQAALAILNATEVGMYKAFASVGRNVYSTRIERIKDQIAHAPKGVGIGELMKVNFYDMTKDELLLILDTLIMMNEINCAHGKYFISNGGGLIR